jgi:hypothetical protein
VAVRLAMLLLVGLAACNDVRDFAGAWGGNRVGDTPALRVGEGEFANLAIFEIDKHGLDGSLHIYGADGNTLLVQANFRSLEAAEADALASMTFAGEPMRVYLAFVPVMAPLGTGDALAIIALYDSRRIELRLLKGEPAPLYAIYALSDG